VQAGDMGTAGRQGELWGRAPQGWVDVQEPMHAPLWRAMLDAASVGSGTRVLDAGCGGGGASVIAAACGADVSGLDAADGLVAFARRRLPAGDFRVGDLEDLPFDDGAFDAVIAANSVQYAADRVAALRELRRVCAAGGCVVAGLFGPPDRVAFAAVLEALRSTLPDPPTGGGPFELSALGRLEALMREAGLTVGGVGEVDCPFVYPDVDTYWAGHVAAGGVQAMLAVVPEHVLRTAAVEAVGRFTDDDGRVVIAPNVFRYVVAVP
jgi:SAM-dependent methyltransferase